MMIMPEEKIKPEDFEKYLKYAETKLSDGDPYASACIIKVLVISEIPEVFKTRVYFQSGILFKLLQNYELSLSCFNAVIDNGGSEEAFLHKASILNIMSKHNEALSAIKCLKEPYDNELFWETAGKAYLGSGYTSDAIKAFTNLKKISPENLNCKKLLAVSLLKAGNYNKAESEINEILCDFPEDLDANLILTWLSLFSEKESEALEQLNYLNAKNIKHPELNFAIASINYLLGDYNKAGKILIEGSKKEPFTANLQKSVTMQILASALTSVASENSVLKKEILEFKEQLAKSFTNMLLEKNFALGDKCRKISETVYFMVKHCEELSADEKEDVRIAGAVCNLGMIYVPDSILTKTTPLTAEEKDILKEHSVKTSAIIKPFAFFKNITETVKCQHEKYDGSGYPSKLKGENIPLSARILAIAKFFVEITNDNQVQKGVPPNLAVRTIQTLTGSFFCPKAFELLKKVYH